MADDTKTAEVNVYDRLNAAKEMIQMFLDNPPITYTPEQYICDLRAIKRMLDY